MGRVSFYAFVDDSLFKVSIPSNANPVNDVIDYDAVVQSTRILSASIQSPAENLNENITIVFPYDKVIIVYKNQ